VSVTPDQYIFLESAFLLAAIVLGGMGTVAGVLVGATVLKLLPEKLRFVADYRLLTFGLLLVLMMRFRPEGSGARVGAAPWSSMRTTPSWPNE
jgi:branched-chain amino acid transport system permease protein